ncbi:MAG: signal peptidase I [Planctomycetaceae bacterium]|nr:signal peptidase I [Planctomycetaceae bacterium]
MFLLGLLAQNDAAAAAAGVIGLVMFLLYFVVIVASIAGLWMVFTKAKKPGWAAIVPIYNLVVLMEVLGKPIWWLLLFFIPCVNIVISFIVMIALAERFGKSAGYGIGLALLPFIFLPLLGFSDARYLGPARQ